MDLIQLVIMLVVGVVAAWIVVSRYQRTRRALEEPIGGDQCVACNSTEVSNFGPECYRCEACGFTWGDGLRELAAQQRRAEIAKLPPAERHSLAVKELLEADARLVSALASLEHSAGQLGMDIIAGGGLGSGDMYSRARNEGLVVAMGEIGTAQKHIRTAGDATGWRIQAGDAEVELNRHMLGADIVFDSMAVDIMAHQQVGKVRHQAQQIQAAVRQVLHQLGAPPR